MRLTHQFLASAVAAGLLAAPGAGRADDGIRTYVVPKERPAPAQAMAAASGADTAMPAADIPVSSAHVTWTTPATWQELAPTSIRIGNFVVKGHGEAKAETAIFSFPGSVGTELDNVNRWRNELKLAPVEQDKIVSEPVTIDGLPGKLYEISGAAASTVVASLPRNGATWFIKMRGDKNVVAEAEPIFRDFLKSIHFADAPSVVSVPQVPSAATAEESTITQPQWTAPANWTETQPGPMVFKSYTATDNGLSANITISDFLGAVGGTFANVNRWRTQMSLPPVEQSDLGSVTQALDTTGGKGTVVDFTGMDSTTGQPGRLIAVAVPHGDSTWFYKITGDSSVVEKQKASFLKFVQTVRYP